MKNSKTYMHSIERALQKGAEVGDRIARDERERLAKSTPFALPTAIFVANTVALRSFLGLFNTRRSK